MRIKLKLTCALRVQVSCLRFVDYWIKYFLKAPAAQ